MNIVIPLHIITLILSVGMYVINFGLMAKKSPYQDNAGIIKLTRVLNMLAVMMIALVCMVSGRAPFDDPVMTEKMLATFAYVFMVFMALKQGKNIFFRSFAFVGSIGWLFYVYSLAVNGEAYLLR